MPESRNSFKLEAAGALSTGVKDRWEATFNGEIVGIGAVVGTAPTGGPLVLNLLKNGSALYPFQVGTIAGSATAQASTGNVDASQTTLDITLVSQSGFPVGVGIEAGSTLVVDSEQFVVSDADPNTPGNQNTEQGSPQGSGQAVYRVTVTRGANGTTAATHNVGAAVSIAKPTIVAGASSTAVGAINSQAGKFVPGDVLSLNVDTVGTTVAGSDLDVNVEYVSD